MPLELLPPEMLLRIVSNLDAHSKTQVALVNKNFRDFAQKLLWGNIELHRTDRHELDSDGTVVLSKHEEIEREYLDDGTGYARIYEDCDGRDPKFDYHNRTFGSVIEWLYRSTETSDAWERLSGHVLHLCLTVDEESPECMWDMILSLPNLQILEIIGDASVTSYEVEHFSKLFRPKATSMDKVRLRGYIPGPFLEVLFEASAPRITSMDLGTLVAPEEYDDGTQFPSYYAPVQPLWFYEALKFSHLTRLHLCKGGSLRLFGRSLARGVALLTDPYRNCELEDYEQWAGILRAARSTLVEVILELRLVVPDWVLNADDMGIHIDEEAPFPEHSPVLPRNFYEKVLKPAFGDGHAWPKLKTLTLHGIFDTEITNDPVETFDTFAARALPGVQVSQNPGHYMFWNIDDGSVRNEGGIDGLKPRKRRKTKPQIGQSFHDNNKPISNGANSLGAGRLLAASLQTGHTEGNWCARRHSMLYIPSGACFEYQDSGMSGYRGDIVSVDPGHTVPACVDTLMASGSARHNKLPPRLSRLDKFQPWLSKSERLASRCYP